MAAAFTKRSEVTTHLLLAAAAAAVVILFVQDAFGVFHFFDRLSLNALDTMTRRRGPIAAAPDSLNVVIVKISDRTEQSLPEHFPFPRSYYARAIRNLNRAGVRAIGIDLIFEQPDAHGRANDDELFETIRSAGNVVVAAKTDLRMEEATVQRAEENYHTIFYAADSGAGSVFVPNDEDGVFRRYMPYAAAPATGEFVPSFAFALVNRYYGLRPRTVAASDGGGAMVYHGMTLPQCDETSMLVNFYGLAGKTFRQYDLADIIDDSTFETTEERELHASINTFDDPEYGILYDHSLAGKIVLIGPYFAESKDLVPVPMAPADAPSHNLMYGVELHANVIQMLIDGNFLRMISGARLAAMVCALTILVVFIVAIMKRRLNRHAWIGEPACLLVCALIVYALLHGVAYAFARWNLVVPVIPLIASVFASYGAVSLHHYLAERKQKAMIQTMFTHYLSPHIVSELIAHPERLRLGGERKELTVMFADVGGFTSLSEQLEPEQIIALLNEYLGAMSDIILAHNGTLDKYEGDAIMAFWGAPLALDNGPLDACRAALAMRDKVEAIRTRWRAEGKPEFSIRIGINTGEMIVGNIGSKARFDYTVIGDSVNIASRLEGANKAYGTTIMISERTRSFVKDELVCRELDDLMVVGRMTPIKVFEPLGERGALSLSTMSEALEHHIRGLDHYRNRRFDEALAAFRNVLDLAPGDGPARVYIKRSERYLTDAPPPEWTGVHSLQTK